MALARTRRDGGMNYWPGFVDALSTLILGIVFLLSVFVVVQFFLSQEVTNKDTVLARLNAQIAQLTELLSMEKSGKSTLEDTIATLRAGLAAVEGERNHYRDLVAGAGSGAASAEGKVSALSKDLDAEKQVSGRALSQIELLNQQIAALRRQLASLEDALEASEKKDKESQARIADLGQRLNVALAQRVQELAKYRSEFFGRLRSVLGSRPDIRVVGDRFVFQSEILFDSGSAWGGSGADGVRYSLANANLELENTITPEQSWVLGFDGHTHVRPS
jgi:chemotaxis protein MotB